VRLGRARGQDEEADVAGLAGRLELGHELGAVVDADGPDPEGHPLGQPIEDVGRGGGRRPSPA
jgi:hypothetical protein